MSESFKQVRKGCELSLVIPCYNEDRVLQELFQRISDLTPSWEVSWEVLLIDDGSSDTTWEMIRAQHQNDPRWVGIRFSRNFGHQTAISAGIWYASGDGVVIMDADLQDPPEVIGQFIKAWREGYDVVYAIRTQRKERTFKRGMYYVFYRILQKLAHIDIPLDSGDFCLMDRKVVDVLNQMPERHRFVRGLRAWAGFRQVGIGYERQARFAGEAKYTYGKLMQLALDGILSFSVTPLHLATYMGFIISGVAFLGVVVTLLQRIFAQEFTRLGIGVWPGFATIVISILFLGGVQRIFLGIIGEYLGRIYDEIKNRPKWLIQDQIGLSDS